MRPTQRRDGVSGLDVLERLLAAPQAFEFVQAVTILLRWLEEQGVPNEQAWRAHLRFANSLRLGFPAGEIEDLRALETDAAQAPQFLLTPSFMGLLGVHGALPLHDTERIQQWQSAHGDEAPRAFLDILSGRMLALYYAAWRKHRVEHDLAHGPDCFMPRLLALAGAAISGTPIEAATRAASEAVTKAINAAAAQAATGSATEAASEAANEAATEAAAGVPAASLAYFAGLLHQRPRSAAVLRSLLAGYFGVPVALQETVGHWSRLAAHEQSALGAARLGENTLLGARSWRPDLRVRLRIGPLDRSRFSRFLPSGDMAAALHQLLAQFAVPGIEFEVQLILRAADVGASRLAGADTPPPRLGRDSFVVTAPVSTDRADMRYLVRPMAPLPPMPAPATRR